MRGDQIPVRILGARVIANLTPELVRELDLRPGDRSIGILTTDCDDASYTALDEATKAADVHVAYARSMYAGASNASTKLAGEFIGILSGPDPEEVRSGLRAAMACIQGGCCFRSACEDDSIVYFAHCISRTGSYLSAAAHVPEGAALAYLIAPPMEAVLGLDAAVKAAQVELKLFYGPPTETNFAGGLLTGDQAACQAACQAFGEAVCQAADVPVEL